MTEEMLHLEKFIGKFVNRPLILTTMCVRLHNNAPLPDSNGDRGGLVVIHELFIYLRRE